MIGKLKVVRTHPVFAKHNGEEVQIILPAGSILEIIRADLIYHEKYNHEEKIYVCQITLNGIKYTDIKIDNMLVSPINAIAQGLDIYRFISPNQAGGKRKRTRRRSHRRRAH